ncbi:peptidylprolyl isomerase [Geomonas sp. RF6]|uniref:peptidylprolyl isomerase n=1 Tax=Geomonas sp. RF6 TaxID=2897342 RepID=UPI001E55D7D6|nr:peptidylprolyl isomerase [Geomonas sp. RF6]UFS72004.1 peptidylprolyl isomerase [Geomonas sp. RF6]
MGKIITCIALLLICAIPAFAAPKVIDSIAAIVNDEVITAHEVDREYAQILKEKNPGSDLIGLRGVALNRLVDKKLIDQKIREAGIKVSDEELKQSIEDVKKQNNLSQEALVAALASQGMSYEEYRNQLREQLERVRLMSQEVRAKIQVGEKEMRTYYDENPERFGGEEVFRARHIFFRLDPKASEAEKGKVEALAAQALKEAKEGKDFKELVKSYSDPVAAKDGGDLGTFRKSDMIPEIGNTVSHMKAGDVSPIVQGPAGLHIIKLEERTVAKAKPFDEVKGEIEDILYKKKSDERFAQWVKDLRNNAAIEIR